MISRVQVCSALADVKWGLWGCMNHKLSNAWDFDYHKYGAWKLARARLKMADEVQPGFGRLGSSMWGFERHGLVPDIATMGKPMGNGVPIAGLVMQGSLAEQLGRDLRYFNTFGGNPVTIAAAQAVLDVIRDEELVANSSVMGSRLVSGLRGVASEVGSIGDVRVRVCSWGSSSSGLVGNRIRPRRFEWSTRCASVGC
jgi:hypothetical protein